MRTFLLFGKRSFSHSSHWAGIIDKSLLDFYAMFPCGFNHFLRLDEAYFIHWNCIFDQSIFSQVHTSQNIKVGALEKNKVLNHNLSLGGFLVYWENKGHKAGLLLIVGSTLDRELWSAMGTWIEIDSDSEYRENLRRMWHIHLALMDEQFQQKGVVVRN